MCVRVNGADGTKGARIPVSANIPAPRNALRSRAYRPIMIRTLLLSFLLLGALCDADTGWPVNGGPYNIRYSEMVQITPANVGKLQVAWSWDAHEAFKDSEMQSNPIVV